MLDRAEVERALRAVGITTPVHWDEVTGSTNATALALAEAGAPEWTLAAAGHQTVGRGRLGRTWEDRPGLALMFSVVLRPDLDPGSAGLLPLLAGAAMAEAGSAASGAEVRCKWPNDLLVGDAKVCGILAESAVREGALQHVVVGLGVNLEAPADVPGAAGLGIGVDPGELLTGFLVRFRDGYAPATPGFAVGVMERWSAISATLGRQVEAVRTDGATVRGRATALDARGGLIVETSEGPSTVAFGEVAHLD